MRIVSRVRTGINPDTSAPWSATLFEQATDEEYEAWNATEEAVAWNSGMMSSAERATSITSNNDKVDFQLKDPASVQGLKSYIFTHGCPPPPLISTGRAHAMTQSLAWFKPTTAQVNRLNFDQTTVSMQLDIKEDEKTHRYRLVSSAEVINTDCRLTAPGVLLTYTRRGWLLYQGDLRFGLSVREDKLTEDPVRNYKGLTQRLTNRSVRTGKGDMPEWGLRSGLKAYMPLTFTDPEGDAMSSDDVSARLGGASMSATIGPAIAMPRSRLMSLKSALEEFAEEGIFCQMTDEQAPMESESITYLCGITDRALKVTKGTKVTVIMYHEEGVEFKRQMYRRNRKGVKDIDLTCRMVCLAPELSDLGFEIDEL